MESRFVYLAFKENLPKFNNICEWFPRSLGWGFLHDPYCIFRIWYGKCLFWHKCMSDFLLILSSLYFLILLLFSISRIIVFSVNFDFNVFSSQYISDHRTSCTTYFLSNPPHSASAVTPVSFLFDVNK